MKGLTLLEVLVVLVILGVLSLLVIPGLRAWKTKNDVENTIKELYATLNEARVLALTEKRACGINWNAEVVERVRLICDANEDEDISDEGDELRWEKDLDVKLKENFSSNYVLFDPRGFAVSLGAFMIEGTEADYDCITVSRTRVKMGKWENGTCVPK